MQQESFWGRVKKNTSLFTNVIGVPSLGNDSDGKLEHETMIHKGLVKFYEEKKGGAVPDWLVENDPTYQGGFQTTNLPSNQRFYPVAAPQEQGHRPNNTYTRPATNSSGADLSARPSVSSKTHTPASASLQDMYRNTRSSGSTGSVPQTRQGGSSNANIRDRLYKTKSSNAAGRLQSSWSRH